MSRSVRVVGMSGAGNDFLVVGPEAARKIGDDSVRWVRRVCARGLSLGTDGVVFVEPLGSDRIAVRFVNPDGSSAFCGNGSRCGARYAHLEGMASASMVLSTEAGEIPAEVHGARVRLQLPSPIDHGEREVMCGETPLRGSFVTAAIPHFVVFVDDPTSAPLAHWGPVLRRHPIFGESGTNVNLAGVDGTSVFLRTWERGVERETLCCGSGAVAAAFAARLRGAGQRLDVIPTGGIPVRVELPGPADAPERAILEGEARVLFRGEIDSEAWEWPG